MKKVERPITKEYLPVKIFLDDLLVIEKILNEETDSIKIKIDDMEFDSVSELVSFYENKNVETVFNLEIDSSGPYISIELRRLWTKIYCSSDSVEVSGIYYKINQVLENCLRKPSFLYSYYTIYIIAGILFISQIFSRSIEKGLLIAAPFYICWVIWNGYIRLGRNSIIYLYNRRKKKGFWKRNADQLVLLVITVILTAAITYYFPSITDFVKKIIS